MGKGYNGTHVRFSSGRFEFLSISIKKGEFAGDVSTGRGFRSDLTLHILLKLFLKYSTSYPLNNFLNFIPLQTVHLNSITE